VESRARVCSRRSVLDTGPPSRARSMCKKRYNTTDTGIRSMAYGKDKNNKRVGHYKICVLFVLLFVFLTIKMACIKI